MLVSETSEAADDGGYGWGCENILHALIQLEWLIVECDLVRRVYLPPAAAMQMLGIHDRNHLQELAKGTGGGLHDMLIGKV